MNSHPLTQALRRRFKTPRDALSALGLDASLLLLPVSLETPGKDRKMTTHFTPDRGFTRARRMGRDAEEEGIEELREMLNDADLDLGDLIAAAIEHSPDDKQEGMYDALRELG